MKANLLKYILANPATREKVSLQALANEVYESTGKQAKLVCDYFSVIKWLLFCYNQTLLGQGKLSPYSVLCDGNIQDYGPAVLSFVDILESIGVVPVFFIDGPPGSNETEFLTFFEKLKKLHEEDFQQCVTIQQICSRNEHLLQIEWSLNRCISTQVEFYLKRKGVRLHYCDGDADFAIINYFHSHEEVCGILSAESSFAVVPGVTLFLPMLMEIRVGLQYFSLGADGLLCEMVLPSTSATLASSLGLRLSQLPDLAFLCNSDLVSVCSKLGLTNCDVTTVAQWLRHREGCLINFPEMRKLFTKFPKLSDTVNRWYQVYVNQTEVDNSCSTTKCVPLSLMERVRVSVGIGSMSSCMLSIANGHYWRNVIKEPVVLGQPCFHDVTLSLRMNLYALMGIKSITEYGRTSTKSFDTIPVNVSFAVDDGEAQYTTLQELSVNERLAILFQFVVNQTNIEESADLFDLLKMASGQCSNIEGDIDGTALLASACILFMHNTNHMIKPSPNIKICEVEALIVTCLASLCHFEAIGVSSRPPFDAVSMSARFVHVIEEVYLFASFLGLLDKLPPPGDIFYSQIFVPFHIASSKYYEFEDSKDQSLEYMDAYKLFNSLIDLKPVLALRAFVLNEPKFPDLSQCLELFSLALEAVTCEKEVLDRSGCITKVIPEEDIVDLIMEGTSTIEQDVCSGNSSDMSVEYNELSTTQECHVSEEDMYYSQQDRSEDEYCELMISARETVFTGSFPSSPLKDEEQQEGPGSPSGGRSSDPFDDTHHDFSRSFQIKQHKMSDLPVISHRSKILELIESHQVVFISGETGCGKSTKIPQFILEEALTKDPLAACKVLVTQPRRVAAMKLAERVAEERNERVGSTVGYCVGGDRQRSASTPITYCTTGYFLQALIHNPNSLQTYTHIVLDEIHERSIDADFTLLVVRKLMFEGIKVKLIIMSATLQGSLLSNYFEEGCDVSIPYCVGAKRYHVSSYFIDEIGTIAEQRKKPWNPYQEVAWNNLQKLAADPPKEQLKAALANQPFISEYAKVVCTELILSLGTPGESILVFLPGIAEITKYFEILADELVLRNIDEHFIVFVLHSQVAFEDQREAFKPPAEDKIHVILATNIAESSITLPQLRIVINFGIYRQLQYDSKRRMSYLVKRWCSQASCAQRAGRAGRVFEGVAVHLFTRHFYNVILSQYDQPEILAASLAKLVLQAKQIGKKMNIPSPTDFLCLAIEPPSLQQMELALKDLADFGAITSVPEKPVQEEADITLVGYFSLHLPLELLLCRLVLFGVLFGIPVDAIVMASYLSLSQDIFSMPSRMMIKDDARFRVSLKKSQLVRAEFDGGHFSEPIMVCNMFRRWIEFKNSYYSIDNSKKSRLNLLHTFCANNAVKYERMLQLESTVADVAIRVAAQVPTDYVLHDELTTLASITEYRKGFRLFSVGGMVNERDVDVPCTDIHFCEDVVTMKALLVAAFSHQLLIGYREIDSPRTRDAERAMKTFSSMQCGDFRESMHVKTSTVSSTGQVEVIVRAVLPHRNCVVRSSDGKDFYVQLTPQVASNLKECCMPLGNNFVQLPSSGVDDLHTFQSEISVVDEKASLDSSFLWQFGERRSIWGVEGSNVHCTRPYHPLLFQWYHLSVERERVLISNWRNPTAFICELRLESSVPLLAVASALQGSEHYNSVSAKGTTILSNLVKSPLSIVTVVAFQSLNSDLQLLMDPARKAAVGVRINCSELRYPGMLGISFEDIARINALRKAISNVINCHYEHGGKLPINEIARVQVCLSCMLHQTPLNLSTSSIHSQQASNVTPVWETACVSNITESEFSIEQEFPLFEYYPPICSAANLGQIDMSFMEQFKTNVIFQHKHVRNGPVEYQRVESNTTPLLVAPFQEDSLVPPFQEDSLVPPFQEDSFKLSPLAQPFHPQDVPPRRGQAHCIPRPYQPKTYHSYSNTAERNSTGIVPFMKPRIQPAVRNRSPLVQGSTHTFTRNRAGIGRESSTFPCPSASSPVDIHLSMPLIRPTSDDCLLKIYLFARNVLQNLNSHLEQEMLTQLYHIVSRYSNIDCYVLPGTTSRQQNPNPPRTIVSVPSQRSTAGVASSSNVHLQDCFQSHSQRASTHHWENDNTYGQSSASNVPKEHIPVRGVLKATHTCGVHKSPVCATNATSAPHDDASETNLSAWRNSISGHADSELTVCNATNSQVFRVSVVSDSEILTRRDGIECDTPRARDTKTSKGKRCNDITQTNTCEASVDSEVNGSEITDRNDSPAPRVSDVSDSETPRASTTLSSDPATDSIINIDQTPTVSDTIAAQVGCIKNNQTPTVTSNTNALRMSEVTSNKTARDWAHEVSDDSEIPRVCCTTGDGSGDVTDRKTGYSLAPDTVSETFRLSDVTETKMSTLLANSVTGCDTTSATDDNGSESIRVHDSASTKYPIDGAVGDTESPRLSDAISFETPKVCDIMFRATDNTGSETPRASDAVSSGINAVSIVTEGGMILDSEISRVCRTTGDGSGDIADREIGDDINSAMSDANREISTPSDVIDSMMTPQVTGWDITTASDDIICETTNAANTENSADGAEEDTESFRLSDGVKDETPKASDVTTDNTGSKVQGASDAIASGTIVVSDVTERDLNGTQTEVSDCHIPKPGNTIIKDTPRANDAFVVSFLTNSEGPNSNDGSDKAWKVIGVTDNTLIVGDTPKASDANAKTYGATDTTQNKIPRVCDVSTSETSRVGNTTSNISNVNDTCNWQTLKATDSVTPRIGDVTDSKSSEDQDITVREACLSPDADEGTDYDSQIRSVVAGFISAICEKVFASASSAVNSLIEGYDTSTLPNDTQIKLDETGMTNTETTLSQPASQTTLFSSCQTSQHDTETMINVLPQQLPEQLCKSVTHDEVDTCGTSHPECNLQREVLACGQYGVEDGASAVPHKHSLPRTLKSTPDLKQRLVPTEHTVPLSSTAAIHEPNASHTPLTSTVSRSRSGNGTKSHRRSHKVTRAGMLPRCTPTSLHKLPGPCQQTQFRISLPKPVPRYCGPPPIPEYVTIPPPRVPPGVPHHSSSYVARYSHPPWVPNMPSQNRPPPFAKFIQYPPEFNVTKKRSLLSTGHEAHCIPDEQLVRYFCSFISLVGEKVSLNYLCGPAYRYFLNSHSLLAKHNVFLSPSFFNQYTHLFKIVGKPGEFYVELTELNTQEAMKNVRVTEKEQAACSSEKENCTNLAGSTLFRDRTESDSHTFVHNRNVTEEATRRSIDTEPNVAFQVARDNNAPPKFNDSEVEETHRNVLKEGHSMQSEDTPHLSPDATDGSLTGSTNNTTNCDSERSDNGHEEQIQKVWSAIDTVSSVHQGDNHGINNRLSVQAAPQSYLPAPDVVHISSAEMAVTNEKAVTCEEINPQEVGVQGDLECFEICKEGMLDGVEGWSDRIGSSKDKSNNQPATQHIEDVPVHTVCTQPWMEVGAWEHDYEREPTSGTLRYADIPAAQEQLSQMLTLDLQQEPLSQNCNVSSGNSNDVVPSRSPPAMVDQISKKEMTYFDDDCWSEYLEVPKVSENLSITTIEARTQTPVFSDKCSLKASLQQCKDTTEQTSLPMPSTATEKIGSTKHMLKFFVETLKHHTTLSLSELCDMYRDSHCKLGLPYNFYVPRDFFRSHSETFIITIRRSQSYKITLVSLTRSMAPASSEPLPISKPHKSRKKKSRKLLPRVSRQSDSGFEGVIAKIMESKGSMLFSELRKVQDIVKMERHLRVKLTLDFFRLRENQFSVSRSKDPNDSVVKLKKVPAKGERCEQSMKQLDTKSQKPVCK